MENDRVVVLIDMDCFYCQVEEKLNPELKGKPLAVVQYNPWKGGGIIAVNYVARVMGVTRHMRGDEAKEKCPEIQLPSVPCSRGKADITKYRDAGKDVARVLQRFTPLLERASIDEAYLDITQPVQERLETSNLNNVNSNIIPNTHALGYDSVEDFISDIDKCSSDSIDFDYVHSRQLLAGAVVVSEIRAAVYEETGFTCSAGIAHNKILAKLVCGMNKPNKQTILPKHSISILYRTLSLTKVKHLGGKFGRIVCETLKITNMGDLQQFSEKELQNKFDEKNGTWLYNIARGIDVEPVQARFNPKSIGCCKQFKGKSALLDLNSLKNWLKDLGEEIEDRLEKDALENNRTPKQMVVSFSTQLCDGNDSSSSRSYNFTNMDDLCGELFSTKAFELIIGSTEGKIKDEDGNQKLNAPIKFLGISVGKFENNNENKKTKKIVDYFGAGSSKNTIKDKVLEPVKLIDVKKDDEEIKNKLFIKEYILNKFFQRPKGTNYDYDQTKPILESSLDQQESFFAKFLGRKREKNMSENDNENKSATTTKLNEEDEQLSSHHCKVLNCAEDSNDTDYTGSTINEEINKSIALFEDDPLDVDRVSKMRELLQSNNKHYDNVELNISDNYKTQESHSNTNTKISVKEQDTVTCTDCGKVIPVLKFATHTDYHIALKLRQEERQQFRSEFKSKAHPINKTKGNKTDSSKHKYVQSIDNFVIKIDNNVPVEICSFCKKRILLHNFSEHLDFHEAQKVSKEINGKTPSVVTNGGKRKRQITSPVKKVKMPCKTIDTFFR